MTCSEGHTHISADCDELPPEDAPPALRGDDLPHAVHGAGIAAAVGHRGGGGGGAGQGLGGGARLGLQLYPCLDELHGRRHNGLGEARRGAAEHL